MDDLAEGNVFAELQIASWPPPVTQTLLRKTDGRLALIVRGKPSGRLRVTLEREGIAPVVVRTVHLRLRTPTVLKVQVVWRGNEMIVAAAGEVIGSTADFAPGGVVSPADIERSAPPVDHVDNDRMRELRRKQVASFLSDSVLAGALADRWLADLGSSALVLEDLAALIRQGHQHHLPGMMAALRLLVQGDENEPALLQFCAGLLDAPLILHVPMALPHGDSPVSLLAAAFDASPGRDDAHMLAIDLDAWLRQEVHWLGASLPVGWLLRQAELALAPRRIKQGTGVLHEDLVRSPPVTDALCRLAQCLCSLAGELARGRLQASGESPSFGRVQRASMSTDEPTQIERLGQIA